MKKDSIFQQKQKEIKRFKFNRDIAEVFDDMVSRSVPFYDEIHKIILDILNRSFPSNGKIYDLGCSTGTTIAIINKFLKETKRKAEFIGVDNSKAMIEKCEEKLSKKRIKQVDLICDDIENIDISEADLVIMNYTLQFIDTRKRSALVKKIYDGLKKGGIFILSEKIKGSSSTINDLLVDLYYDFKRRNGYSELEISQKREALENVLVPYPPEKQMELLKKSGFTNYETIFRWYNFACFIGIK